MKKQLLSIALAGAMMASMSVNVMAKKSRVYLSRSKISAVQGKKYTLKMRGTSRKVKWSSTKKSVASVTSKGKITAKKAGTAYVKAKVGGKTYKCKVTVKKPVISAKKATLYVGMVKNLKLNNNALKVQWITDNTQVATVTKSGKVTAVAPGTAYIQAVVNKRKYTCRIKILTPTISKTDLSVAVGDSKQLTLKYNRADVNWTSSNDEVAEVDADGNVSGITAGTATISAAVSNVVLSCNVTVNESTASTTAATDTQTQETTQETETVRTPTTASSTSSSSAATTDARSTTRTTYTNGVVGQTIKASSKIGSGSFSSSDTSVAIVSKSGLVMPFKAGDVTITNDDTGDSLDITITDPGNVRVGVDISRHNGSVDFNKMKNAGIQFAIIRGGNTLKKLKTTTSKGIDLNLKTNIDKAEAAGMDYGVYWYMNSSDNKGLMSVDEARAQANQLGATLKSYQTSHFTLPVYLDLEETKALIHGSTKADKAAYIQSLCQAFSETLANYGFTNIGIYSSTSWYNNYLQNDYFVSNFGSYWLAHYGYNSVSGAKIGHYTAIPSWKYNGNLYWPDIWQTGSDFKISGVSGYVDMNYRYLS